MSNSNLGKKAQAQSLKKDNPALVKLDIKPTSLHKDIRDINYDGGYPIRKKIENTEKQLFNHLEDNCNYFYII